jgi:hypothetical protein
MARRAPSPALDSDFPAGMTGWLKHLANRVGTWCPTQASGSRLAGTGGRVARYGAAFSSRNLGKDTGSGSLSARTARGANSRAVFSAAGAAGSSPLQLAITKPVVTGRCPLIRWPSLSARALEARRAVPHFRDMARAESRAPGALRKSGGTRCGRRGCVPSRYHKAARIGSVARFR